MVKNEFAKEENGAENSGRQSSGLRATRSSVFSKMNGRFKGSLRQRTLRRRRSHAIGKREALVAQRSSAFAAQTPVPVNYTRDFVDEDRWLDASFLN